MGLGQVGLRPLGGMVGVRMIEADDVFAALASLRAGCGSVPWDRCCSGCGRNRCGCCPRGRLKSRNARRLHPFVRAARRSIRGDMFLRRAALGLRILCDGYSALRSITVRGRFGNTEITKPVLGMSVWSCQSSSQNRSLKYLSPESHRIVTNTALVVQRSCDLQAAHDRGGGRDPDQQSFFAGQSFGHG